MQREAQVKGCGVQRTGGGLKFEAKRFISVERGGLLDEDVSEVGEGAPVAFFVGVGPRAAGGGLADAGVIELWAEGSQAGFAVAQTFAPGQLSESEDEELFVGGQFADAEVAAVTRDPLVKLVLGEAVQKLGEDRATFVPKVANRWLAVEPPRKPVAKLKSKKVRTARERRFYRNEIAVRKNLTGQ